MEPRLSSSREAPVSAVRAEERAPTRGGWARGLSRRLCSWLRVPLQVLVIAWGTLAIVHSNLPWEGARVALAIAFAVFGAWALWGTRGRTRWAFGGALLGVIVWHLSIRPSHDRPWAPEVAVMPRAAIDGDRVRLTGVRHFDYRSVEDFTARWEEREFSMAAVASVDLFISYWREGPVGHTFVSFLFDDGTPPLCISIEVRPEAGEGYSPIGSMFKKYELVYVVGDERDIVGVRAAHRGEDVYLYRIRTTPQGARRLLRVYLERINELADRPEFYHLLKNSCTVNIVRYATEAAGMGGMGGARGRFDIRHLLNGWVDRYLYDAGLVDTSMPFGELRRRSRITDVAKATGDAGYSSRIRASVPAPGR